MTSKYGSATNSQHSFANIQQPRIPRSMFDRSGGVKTTFDVGDLIPIYCDEAMPGDTFNLNATLFARFNTPIVPIIDNMYLETFWFSVPLRLLWVNFQKMMGEQLDPGDSTDFTIPTVASGTGFVQDSLHDYLGLPTKVPNLDVSAMYGRAYNRIWNEWFRDEQLQDRQTQNNQNGPDTLSWYTVQKRGKRKDYFTSCLPSPQKGDAIEVPLGGTIPINAIAGNFPTFTNDAGVTDHQLSMDDAANVALWDGVPASDGDAVWEITGLEGDLSSATNVTINQLRQAFQLQVLAELDNRAGTRYTEMIRAHFGVTSPDQRLQRPEFLGGGRQNLNMTPVPQTSESATTPQGNISGYGVTIGSGHGFVHSFTEHCIVMGLVNVRADLNYQQGVHKQFTRGTVGGRFDFYFPALAHLGEQAVLNEEIYAQGDANDDLVFGYQERWAEYRYRPGQITGAMRSNHTGTLDVWHLAQDFDSLPVLGSDYIEEDPPIERIVATPAEADLLMDGHIRLTCARPMPMFSTPGNIDRL